MKNSVRGEFKCETKQSSTTDTPSLESKFYDSGLQLSFVYQIR